MELHTAKIGPASIGINLIYEIPFYKRKIRDYDLDLMVFFQNIN